MTPDQIEFADSASIVAVVLLGLLTAFVLGGGRKK